MSGLLILDGGTNPDNRLICSGCIDSRTYLRELILDVADEGYCEICGKMFGTIDSKESK